MKIDFHCHHPQESHADKVIYSHAKIFEPIPKFVKDNNCPYTIGLHPWFLPDNLEVALKTLTQHFSEANFVGLGECGLDRLQGRDLETQMTYFSAQLDLAHTHGIAFVVLHCVRAFSECLMLLKNTPFKGKIVFHDYGANTDITSQLLKDSRIYFSLGRALERSSFCENSLKLIPLERILLETDDEHISIDMRYHQLQKHGETVPLTKIENMLVKNLMNILG
jgi:TatD DNase family protein